MVYEAYGYTGFRQQFCPVSLIPITTPPTLRLLLRPLLLLKSVYSSRCGETDTPTTMAKRRNPNPNRPSPRLLLLLFFFLSFLLLLSLSDSSNVTYDHRSLIVNGRRLLLISASIHYPRSVPAVLSPSLQPSLFLSLSLSKPHFLSLQMWPGLVAAAKEGGADAIETYVFWNGHEISPGEVVPPISDPTFQ